MVRATAVAPDWFAATGPDELVRYVWPRPPGQSFGRVAVVDLPAPVYRRLRLFGVACARQVWDLLTTDDRNGVRASERFADGRATLDDLLAVAVPIREVPLTARQLARNAVAFAVLGYEGGHPSLDPRGVHVWNPFEAARWAARALARVSDDPVALAAARVEQADFLRDVFPPPGHTPRVDSHWLTSAVVGLARSMDATGDFTAVPILADALEEAGCDDPAVLDRCRFPGPHTRGNWVVDMILGRD